MPDRSRREFLTRHLPGLAAGGWALAARPAGVAGSAPQPLPIVDTHQHLWDLKQFQPPWLKDAPQVLSQSHVSDDYREATRGLSVVKAIYMEIDVAPADQTAEARHVISLARRKDTVTVAAVISGRPNSPQFADYLAQFREAPEIKGVRQVLHVPSAPRGLCLQPQFVRSVKLLGAQQKNFDLCMRPTELQDAAKLADLCPETTLVLDHCGNADPKAFQANPSEKPWHAADPWKREIEALAKRKNVVCKISGIVARAPQGWDAELLAPIVNHCLDSFGPERVVFGGDWPVCKLGATFRQWVAALREIIAPRPLAEQRKLLHDNALRVYRLA